MDERTNKTSVLGIYAMAVGVLCLAGLAYVYLFPPTSMKTDRTGVAHFTPSVINPDTGEPIDMSELVRHFRGD